MCVNTISGAGLQAGHEGIQIVLPAKLQRSSAPLAKQHMPVARRAHNIDVTTRMKMHTSRETQFLKQLQRPIDGHQPQPRMEALRPL